MQSHQRTDHTPSRIPKVTQKVSNSAIQWHISSVCNCACWACRILCHGEHLCGCEKPSSTQLDRELLKVDLTEASRLVDPVALPAEIVRVEISFDAWDTGSKPVTGLETGWSRAPHPPTSHTMNIHRVARVVKKLISSGLHLCIVCCGLSRGVWTEYWFVTRPHWRILPQCTSLCKSEMWIDADKARVVQHHSQRRHECPRTQLVLCWNTSGNSSCGRNIRGSHDCEWAE